MLTNDLRPGKTGTLSKNAALVLSTYTVASLPPAASYPGRQVWVTNGAGGAPCLAVSNGTAWLRIVPGAAVNATT
jgi:hypothetical protein